jgi:hypothetical protein
MSSIARNAQTLKWVAWAAVATPFAFLLFALFARFSYPGPAYEALLGTAFKVEMFAPLLGLVLGIVTWKSRVGKVAVGINVLAITFNLLWFFVFLPQALKSTSLF